PADLRSFPTRRSSDLLTTQQTNLEARLAEDEPVVATAQDTWYKLSALAERLRGTVRLAVERQRHLSAEVEQATSDRDPDEMLAEAEQAATEEAELTEAVESAREALTAVTQRREQAEQAAQAAEQAHRARVSEVADRREGMAKLSGQVEALRSKTGATAEEIERLDTGIEEAKVRAETAAEELEQVKAEDGSGEADDAELQQRYEQAVAANDAADARVNELVDAERGAERDIASE